MTLISAAKPYPCQTRGSLGEHFFEGYFLEKGVFIAAPPYEHHRVDYVVDWHGQLVRVNVKTLSSNGSNYQCSTRTSAAGGGKRKYLPGEIDYFGIVSLEYERIWMIPFDVVNVGTLIWHQPEKFHRKYRNSFDWGPYLIKWVDNTNSLKLS